MEHESRLTIALRSLLQSQRVAALGTIDEAGAPYVSMVPYAMTPSLGCLVIHVSGLAAHSRNLQAMPNVSLLVMQSEVRGGACPCPAARHLGRRSEGSSAYQRAMARM